MSKKIEFKETSTLEEDDDKEEDNEEKLGFR